MKIRELRKMTRLARACERTQEALISKCSEFSGKGKKFFEDIAKALELEDKEAVEEINKILFFSDGGDSDLCFALEFIAKLKKTDSRLITNNYLTSGIDVKDMELKDHMEYGLSGGDHFYLLISIRWDKENVLVKRGHRLQLVNVWDLLRF